MRQDKDMLFVVDVGNTHITFGVFYKGKLLSTFRMTTARNRTSDEFGYEIKGLLESRKITVGMIDAVIISSVVPGIMHSFRNAILKYFRKEPLIVGAGTKTGIKLGLANPREVGADRIVDVVAAYEMYGGPLLVLDFGTATTYDLISGDGTFMAGVICPGIRICAKALQQGTAKLPEIEIKKPDTILGRDTISSMQAGIVYGYIGQTEYLIDRMKRESGMENIKVIATGGLGKIIFENTDRIDEYNPNLTLEGLRIIYEKSTRQEKF